MAPILAAIGVLMALRQARSRSGTRAWWRKPPSGIILDAGIQLNRLKTLEEALDHILKLATKLADAEAGSVVLLTPHNLDFLDVGVGITIDRLFFGQIGGDRCYDISAIGEGVGHASLLSENARGGHRILHRILCAKHFLKAASWRERLTWVKDREREPIATKPGDKLIDVRELYYGEGR